MALSLPNPRNVFLPEVPSSIQDKAIREYLIKLRVAVELQLGKSFDNTYSLVSTGSSGSFLASGGATITVQSGIITALS